MQTWVQQLGPKQHATLSRLTKNAVRNHENMRLSGDGGAAPAQGTFAYNQGLQTQNEVQSYVHQIPGVSQAQSLLGRLDHSGRRELEGTATAPSGPPLASMHFSPIPGRSASHYSPPYGAPPASYGSHPAAYGSASAGSGSPPAAYGSTPAAAAPPMFPAPSFPASGPEGEYHHHGHHHYAPPPGAPPEPTFPYSTPYGTTGAGLAFPGAQPHHPQYPDAAPNFPPPSGGYDAYGGNRRW